MSQEENLLMVTYVMASLFESPAQVLVNTVNTVGVMGKGIAREFKLLYPEMFRLYQRLCDEQRFDVGQLWLYKTPHKWILNFPTKRDWRHPSKVEYVELGLKKFVETYAEKGITSVAFPQLGCGNGELDWESQVRPLMERYLNRLPINIVIHIYSDKTFPPEHRVPKETAAWLRSEPANLPFSEVMQDILDLLRKRTDFNSINGQCTFKCYAWVDSQGYDGILIDDGRHICFIENWQMYDLWQQIRDYGFCANDRFDQAAVCHDPRSSPKQVNSERDKQETWSGQDCRPFEALECHASR